MKRFISLLAMLLALAGGRLMSQNVTNVVARQVGNTVEVTYNIDRAAAVSMLFSTDGGNTYTTLAQSLTGDIGQVQPGNRKIVWNMLQDAAEWEVARARFKIMAKDDSRLTFTANGVSFTMVAVQGGTFTMGCTAEQGSDCESDEKPAHSVSLNDYFIGQTEVTQGLWKAVMGSNPASFKNGDSYPVETVSWDDCQQFISRLNSLLSSQLGGKRFALPTEAQWEYAARGGKKSNGYKYAGSNSLSSVGWYTDNSSSSTHPVAQKAANELGLYDMSGNVWEWCQDWYGSYSRSAQSNPSGAASGSGRVLRGGSWDSRARGCRVSFRLINTPSYCGGYYGLRLVCQ